MNKTELVAAVAEQAGLSRKDAEAAVKAFTDVVADALKNGDKIQLVGFGTFEVSESPDFCTIYSACVIFVSAGESMKIEACKTPKFKAGKALKDLVNA